MSNRSNGIDRMGSALRTFVIVATLLAGCASEAPSEILQQTQRYPTVIELPAPDLNGTLSLEQALDERRSVREYAATPLTLDEVGQLLWAGQGITDDDGYRTAPSAGARYPLELYTVTAADLMTTCPSAIEWSSVWTPRRWRHWPTLRSVRSSSAAPRSSSSSRLIRPEPSRSTAPWPGTW